jgi:hypothetical protein
MLSIFKSKKLSFKIVKLIRSFLWVGFLWKKVGFLWKKVGFLWKAKFAKQGFIYVLRGWGV